MWWWLLAVGVQAQTLSVGQLSAGDLVITEVLQDPTVSADADGEWFEVRNAAAQPVDLFGLEVSDLGVDFATVSASVVIPVGGYAVIGVNSDTLANGGVVLDHAMSLTLANGDDELILSASGYVIDQIFWDGGASWPDPSGASMALDGAMQTAAANDNGLNWCDGVAAFGAGDLGTPGAANPSCSGGTGVGTGTGGGSGTGGPGDSGYGTGTGTGTGSGAGTGGTAATGTGTGEAPPTYNKLGCGCASGGGSTSWLWLGLPLLALRRRD